MIGTFIFENPFYIWLAFIFITFNSFVIIINRDNFCICNYIFVIVSELCQQILLAHLYLRTGSIFCWHFIMIFILFIILFLYVNVIFMIFFDFGAEIFLTNHSKFSIVSTYLYILQLYFLWQKCRTFQSGKNVFIWMFYYPDFLIISFCDSFVIIINRDNVGIIIYSYYLNYYFFFLFIIVDAL